MNDGSIIHLILSNIILKTKPRQSNSHSTCERLSRLSRLVADQEFEEILFHYASRQYVLLLLSKINGFKYDAVTGKIKS